jgi:transposase
MDRQYVGIDFHRRRSVIVRLDAVGEQLAVTRVDNDPFAFAAVMADAGEASVVVIEATYGWYWVVDLLQEVGTSVYLANPNALNWRRHASASRWCDRRRPSAAAGVVGPIGEELVPLEP